MGGVRSPMPRERLTQQQKARWPNFDLNRTGVGRILAPGKKEYTYGRDLRGVVY